jgi:hypothetical protein
MSKRFGSVGSTQGEISFSFAEFMLAMAMSAWGRGRFTTEDTEDAGIIH